MKQYTLGCIVLLLFFRLDIGQAQELDYSLNVVSELNYTDVKKGFLNPPKEAKIRSYWWWLNGMATKESISRDLSEMKAKGYGGAIVFDAGSSNYQVALKTESGPVFASPEWHELFAHAVKVSDSLDMELSLNIQSGWNPGGPSVTAEEALKKIVTTKIEIEGSSGVVSVMIPKPESNEFYEDILVQAYPSPSGVSAKIKNWEKKSMNSSLGWKGILPIHQLKERSDEGPAGIRPSEIIDITEFFKNDTLRWKAPKGKWTVVRYGMTNTGAHVSTGSDGWSGRSYNHLSKQPFKTYFDAVVKPILETAKKSGNSLKFLHTDSWEMGSVNWTDTFMDDFKRLRGYDMTPYLPVLTNQTVKNGQVSDRFLYDFRRTVGDLVHQNNYVYFAELAKENGMGTHPESGGPHSAPVDALQVMGTNDIPMGEFWARNDNHRIKDSERLSVKQGASASHIYGKRFMAAEGPTSIGPQWERSPNDLKGVLDRIFTSGVNRLVWHTFTSSPDKFGMPGNEYFAGTHLNTKTTWWELAGAFTDYINRCTYLLSLGHFQADALYYYGDEVPNFVFLKTEVEDLGFGYDWDKVNSDVLLQHAQVKNNKLILTDGMQYSVLSLHEEESIRLDVFRKIEQMVNEGLTVVGSRPKRAKGLRDFKEADKEVAEIANRLWGTGDASTGENKVGKGMVVYGKPVGEVLADAGVATDFGFKSANENTKLEYIHRKTNNFDIYFVVNSFLRKGIDDFEYRYDASLPNRYELVDAEFRITNGIPEIWNPIDASITKPLTYRHEGDRTIVSMYLKPEESKFVIFKTEDRAEEGFGIAKDGVSLFPVSKNTKVDDYPPYNLVSKNNTPILEAFEPGTYSVGHTGQEKNINIKPFNTNLAIEGSWNISFDPYGQEKFVYLMDNLVSWTEVDDVRIKYYSGKAVYSTEFKLPKKQKKDQTLNAYLDLGNLQDVAVVRLNGQEVRTLWKAPYRVSVNDYLNAGTNSLEIEIVNLWPNRLIGDGKLPQRVRKTKTNINKFNQADAERYLRTSGLLGPVRLRFSKKVKL